MQSSTMNKTSQQIPTIRYVYRNLKQAHDQLQQVFTDIGIIPIESAQDLEEKKVTINKALGKIPANSELENQDLRSSKQSKREHLSKYNGDISLIQKAKENYGQLKKQQQKIYYLSSWAGMLAVSPQFKQKSPENYKHLHSYQDVIQFSKIHQDGTQQKKQRKTKLKPLQKNSLSDIYLQQGQAQLDNKNQPVTKFAKKTQQLKRFDLLVHVNFYDSHNVQKQYEFICLEQQNLGSIVQKFKCMIQTLVNVEKIRKKQEKNDGQCCEIYDKYYHPPPQRSSNKLHSHRIDAVNATSLKYFIIEDAIYYEGNKNELDQLITTAYNRDKINYRLNELGKTKLCDLRVIFGKPYLYRHMEGCDHLIIFKQARLFMGNDEYNHDILQIQKYPITVYQSKMKRKKCEGCCQYFSDIVSICDPLKKGENLYVCRHCHKDLHFDENGRSKFGDQVKFVNYIHD